MHVYKCMKNKRNSDQLKMRLIRLIKKTELGHYKIQDRAYQPKKFNLALWGPHTPTNNMQ